MPVASDPDVPTIEDIKNQIQKAIDDFQKEIDEKKAKVAVIDEAITEALIELAEKVAKANKAGNLAEVERLRKENDAFRAEKASEAKPLNDEIADIEARKKEIQEKKADMERAGY